MGIALAKVSVKKADSKKIILLFVLVGIIASNILDLDFLLNFFVSKEDRTLNYLLNHRGITHTLIATPFLGLLCAKIVSFFLKIKINFKIIIFSTFACLLHVFADFWNSYGVHPFSPFHNHWYSGDFIFIVEPYIWLTFLPLLFNFSKIKTYRNFFSLILAISMFLLIWNRLSHFYFIPTFLTAYFFINCGMYLKFKNAKLMFYELVIILIAFGVTSISVKKEFEKNHKAAVWGLAKDQHLYDVMTLPEPANPFCYRVIALFADQKNYSVQAFKYGIFPKNLSDKICSFYSQGDLNMTAQVIKQNGNLSESRFISLWGYFASIGETLGVIQEYPKFKSFLKFARFPFWHKISDGKIVYGDLRFDRDQSLGFSEEEVTSSDSYQGFDPELESRINQVFIKKSKGSF